MRKTIFITVALLLLSFAGTVRAAYSIEPAIIRIRPHMNENMAWVDVVHTGGGPMAIDLAVLERELDLDGDVVNSDKRVSDFTVYPAQIILYPGENTRVQIVYNGRQRVTADKAYFLFSKEAPLSIAEDGGEGVRIGITSLMSYYSVISMETNNQGRLTFVSSRSIEDGKIELIVENRSRGRVPVDHLYLTIGGRNITNFTGKKNSIMPGQQRRFTFAHPRPVSARDVNFNYR